jgi:hypothetical protein
MSEIGEAVALAVQRYYDGDPVARTEHTLADMARGRAFCERVDAARLTLMELAGRVGPAAPWVVAASMGQPIPLSAAQRIDATLRAREALLP